MKVPRSQKTKAIILDAAEQVFVSEGYQGATFEKIARVAGVAPSLISHYFRSKSALWKEVKKRLLEPLSNERARLLTVGTSHGELREAMLSYMRWLRANPRAMRLTLWLAVLKEDTGDDGVAAALFDALLAWGKTLGRIPADVDARALALMLLALAEYPETSRAQANGIIAGTNAEESEQRYGKTLDWVLDRLFTEEPAIAK